MSERELREAELEAWRRSGPPAYQVTSDVRAAHLAAFRAGVEFARCNPGPATRGGTVNSFWLCVCGATEGHPNDDCERCQLVTEILELRAQVLNPRPRAPGPATAELAALIHADLIEAAVGFGRLIPESGFDIRLSPISVEKLRAFVAEAEGQGVPR